MISTYANVVVKSGWELVTMASLREANSEADANTGIRLQHTLIN